MEVLVPVTDLTTASNGILAARVRPRTVCSGAYRVYLASSDDEREAAFRLRFRVFNLELGEGLEQAFASGRDIDEFDRFCDHIIVEHEPTGQVIGTYRLQTGTSAACNIGFYSAREFDFSPYEKLCREIIELGRACIHPDHRKYEVLMLLWKAITRYAMESGAHFLIGCSSLTSQDPAVGSAVYEGLKSTLAPDELRTRPVGKYQFPLISGAKEGRPPKLLRTYLCLGAWICGEPAIDREFKTIDFLTLMDLNKLTPSIRARLMED